MFDNITAARHKLRRGPPMLVSILLHGAAIGLGIALTYARAHIRSTESAVAVTFRPPPPPPPPPPPAAHKPRTPRTPKPVTPKVSPQVMVQPKEVPKEEAPPEEPPEEEEEGEEGGVEGGVVGGVQGGVLGGVQGGVIGGTAPQRMEFNDTMTPPKLVSGPDPKYTEKAQEHEVEGLIVVKCVVTMEGVVHGCRVLQSLPFMDRAVIEALERRRYTPALLQGRPVEVDYIFKIRLTLPQ